MTILITTPAGSHARIEEMEGILFSDFHKDVYGYRPRGATWDYFVNLSIEFFNETLDSMMDKMEDDAKEKKELEEAALRAFKAELRAVMVEANCDWKEAMLCLLQADAVEDHDIDFWLWKKDLSFAKQREILTAYFA